MVSGTVDRDTFFVNNAGTWVEFKDLSYFRIKKGLNQMSEFEITIFDIQDAQKVYFKEQAEILFFVGLTKILKGRIQTIEYATAYECTAKGFGMEIKLLDKDLIKSGDKRVEYDNISAQTIAKEILSVNTNGVSPWIINPGTDGLFTTDFGNTTLRFEYANRMNCIGLLCNTITYEWETYQSADPYATDYLRIKSLIGTQTSVKTFDIAGANSNCSSTSRNVDMTNLVNYIDVLGYGDGINQLKTSTYNASTIYSILSSDITATQNTVPLVDASAFATSGTIRIMEERINYTGKSVNTLTGCTRGRMGTIPKAHKKNVYVEKYYAVASPETNSSIQKYGLMDYTLIDRTIMDIDTLEVIASGYLLDRMTPIISITITPDEPTTDVLLNMGDMITINDAESGITGSFRIVGFEYKDDYGSLSLDISVSNRSLEFIEQMNKARQDQQNMGKYMQGATNIYALMETTEGDASNYINNRFWMPTEVTALNKVLVNFKMKPVKTLKIIKQYKNTTYEDTSLATSFEDLGYVTVDVATGEQVLVLYSARLHTNSTDDLLKLRCLRDSTILNIDCHSQVDNGTFDMTAGRSILDTPGSGTFTYKVQGTSDSGTGDCFQGTITIIVFSTGFSEGSLTDPSVGVYVGEDGGTMNLIGTYTTDQNDLDITSACQAIGVNKWIDIQFRPNQEMRIEMNAYVQMFLEST